MNQTSAPPASPRDTLFLHFDTVLESPDLPVGKAGGIKKPSALMQALGGK